MTIQSREKINAIKYVERRRRKFCFLAGTIVGIGSSLSILICLKKFKSKRPDQFQTEKTFYCTKFGEIKNALCDIKAHIGSNIKESAICENCCPHCDDTETE